jgi:anti-anti-sigma factor
MPTVSRRLVIELRFLDWLSPSVIAEPWGQAAAPQGRTGWSWPCEIDMATAGLFRQALDRAHGGDGHVTIDLAHTTFMDSSGLAVVIGAYDRLGRRPDAVALRNAGPPLRQILELTGATAW